MKLPKSSTLLFVNIFILLIVTIFFYILLFKNITLNETKNQEVFFYQIKSESSKLLTKVLYKYSLFKPKMYEIHTEALNMLDRNNSLEELSSKLIDKYKVYPSYVAILNDDFTIEYSLGNDKEKDFSAYKNLFNDEKNFNEIFISLPEYSKESKKFISYSFSKIKDSGKILKLAYTYGNLQKDFNKLEEYIKSIKNIEYYSFFMFNDNYIGKETFKDIDFFKKIIRQNIEDDNISCNIERNLYISSCQKIEDKYLNVAYFLEDSLISEEIKMLFYVVFNEDEYYQNIFKIRMLSLIIFIVGTIALYLIYKFRTIELLLNYKDKFIAHSIHEIKTPLSIISINTQLREKIYGRDKFTKKIEGALRTLENSYEDMTFLHTKDKIVYQLVEINLKKTLENRVRYFETIAEVQNRKIKLNISNNFYLKMGRIELNRLIDNNISNAIKYSFIASTIEVVLKDNVLEFISQGQQIYDPKGIFKRYKREDNSSGGHGLGLAIVSDICKKYNFKIEVESKASLNIFRYILY